MSRIHRYLAESVFGEPVMMSEHKLHQVMGVLLDGQYQGYEPEDDEEEDDAPEELPIAVISVHGSLVKRSMGVNAMSGLASYASLESQIRSAAAEGKDILLDIDSPGGEAMGVFTLTDAIAEVKKAGSKVYCIANPAYSAAYAIAAACDRIYVPKDSEVGSIGVIAAHMDVSEAEKKAGVKYTLITAGDHKADMSPHKPLSTDAKARMQEKVDAVYQQFVSHVARERNIPEQAVIETQADLLDPNKAIPQFADRIGTLRDAMADMQAERAKAEASGPISITVKPIASMSQSQVEEFANQMAQRISRSMSHKEAPKLNSEIIAELIEEAAFDRDFVGDMYGLTIDKRKTISAVNFGASLAIATHLLDRGWRMKCETPAAPAIPIERDGKQLLTGLLVPYNSPSAVLPGGFREIYEPGCFGESLKDDIRFLCFHDETKILGRTSAGTARLFEREDGVHFEVDLSAASYAQDIRIAIERGDIGGSSAGFYLRKDGFTMETRGGETFRRISKAQLSEGSITATPAYKAATAELSTTSAQPSGPAAALAFDEGIYALRLKQIELAGQL